MVFFKSEPWLQREGDHHESFDDANNSFILSSSGWVYFKMILFDDLSNSSCVRVFWGLLPCDDDLSEDPKNALTMDFFFDGSRILKLPSRWCSLCLQNDLELKGSSWLFYDLYILIQPWYLRAWVSLIQIPFLDLLP